MRDIAWIWAILKANWANMVSHPKAFYTMMLLMVLQNLIYFGLWVIIFSKISSLRGWGLSEVAYIYASVAIGYGFFFMIFGGLNQLAETIQNGTLDVHLARPRRALILATMSRMRGDSIGDILSGVVMLALFVRPAMETWPLMIALIITAGLVFMSFRLICHSCAFWGLNEDASERNFMAFIIISTNPQNGFTPLIKMALLTVFPAAYSGLLPVQILQEFSWSLLAMQIFGAGIILTFALWLFHFGLRRYTSGNQMVSMR